MTKNLGVTGVRFKRGAIATKLQQLKLIRDKLTVYSQLL